MGALHDGHIALVNQSVAQNHVSCVSIFVNPLQFNNPEDLQNYPQTLSSDIGILQTTGCDMVFRGTLEQFFPEAADVKNLNMLDPGPAAQGLEGALRPGHLEGVATIVDRLFRTVGNCRAYFGEKDFQQTLVVKHLVQQLFNQGIQIDIQVCPTIREPSGLALSSRNQRLTSVQKQLATCIYNALFNAKLAWQDGQHDIETLQKIMLAKLTRTDFTVEYAEIRDEDNWTADSPVPPIERPRALIAAVLGDVRLIDNMALHE